MAAAPEKKKKRLLRWLLPPAAAVLLVGLLVLGLTLVVGRGGLSARYDEPEAILGAYNSARMAGLSLREDGTAELRLGKEDLYYLLSQYDPNAPEHPFFPEESESARLGFRFSAGKVILYTEQRALGLLPLSYRATASMERRDAVLTLRVESVTLGTRYTLSPRRWPRVFRQEELTLDLSGAGLGEQLLDARLEDDRLVLELRGLRDVSLYGLMADWELMRTLDILGGDAPVDELYERLRAAFAAETPPETLREEIARSPDAASAMAELMSLCRSGSLHSLWDGDSRLVRAMLWKPLEQRAAERRQTLETYLASEQEKYERLLFALREMYRSGALKIGESGFVSAATGEVVDPAALSRLPVTDMDSRIVFLTAAEAASEISLEDMPPLSTISRVNWQTAPLVDPALVLDVGVVLPTRGDVPVLLCRKQDGALLIREISEELFISVLVDPGIYTLDADELPPAAETVRRRAGEGWNGAVIWTLPS